MPANGVCPKLECERPTVAGLIPAAGPCVAVRPWTDNRTWFSASMHWLMRSFKS